MQDLTLVEKEVEGTRFKINNKMLFLTYSQADEISKKIIKKHIRNLFAGKKVKITNLYIAKERHKDDHTHYHVAISLDKAFQTANCRFFDIQNIHPNIKICKTARDWVNVLTYMRKEDKKTGIDSAVEDLKNIWNCDSLGEAYALGLKPMDTKLYFEAKPIKSVKKIDREYEWYPWQLHCLDKMKTQNERQISVYMDTQGNTGKTTLARYIRREKLGWCVKNVGTMRDFANNAKSALASGWDGKVVIFDLTRANADRISIYECIECVKDGWLTSTKYEGGDVEFADNATVIIFSNWWPELRHISLDRWDLYAIDHKTHECSGIDKFKLFKEQDEENF